MPVVLTIGGEPLRMAFGTEWAMGGRKMRKRTNVSIGPNWYVNERKVRPFAIPPPAAAIHFGF